MPPTDLQRVFMESASEVMETMFFTGVVDESSIEEDVPRVSAELEFYGRMAGSFGVQVPLETGKAIAANFLGVDEASPQQVEDVVCELSNMLCGSVLSRIDSGALYELKHPEVDRQNRGWQDRPDAIGYTFALEEGTMTIWMRATESVAATPAA